MGSRSLGDGWSHTTRHRVHPGWSAYPGWCGAGVVRDHPADAEGRAMTTTRDQESAPVTTTAPDHDHHVSRRGLLRAVGLGGATVLVAGTGALSYRVYDTAALNPGSGDGVRPVAAVAGRCPGRSVPWPRAVLAASPHNTQPWAFALGADSRRRLRRPTREGPARSTRCAASSTSASAAPWRTSCSAAARAACAPEVTLAARRRRRRRVANVALGVRRAESGPLYDAIGDRHTNRGPYTLAPIPPGRWRRSVDPTGLRRPGRALDRRPEPEGGAVAGC